MGIDTISQNESREALLGTKFELLRSKANEISTQEELEELNKNISEVMSDVWFWVKNINDNLNGLEIDLRGLGKNSLDHHDYPDDSHYSETLKFDNQDFDSTLSSLRGFVDYLANFLGKK